MKIIKYALTIFFILCLFGCNSRAAESKKTSAETPKNEIHMEKETKESGGKPEPVKEDDYHLEFSGNIEQDIQAGLFSIDGTVMQLPLPLKILENHWTSYRLYEGDFPSNDIETSEFVPAHEGQTDVGSVIHIKMLGTTVKGRLYNSKAQKSKLADCEISVLSMEYPPDWDTADKPRNLELPGGLRYGDTLEHFKELYDGKCEYEIKEETKRDITIGFSGNSNLVMKFYKRKDGSIRLYAFALGSSYVYDGENSDKIVYDWRKKYIAE